MSHDDVEDLTNRLVSWYRIKIPNSIFIESNGKIDINTESANYSNYINMTFGELLQRNKDLNLLKCGYRNMNPANNSGTTFIIKLFTLKGIFNNREDKVCRILADSANGNILGIEGDYLLPKKLKENYTNYKVEEIFSLLKKEAIEGLNYDDLKICINDRNKSILTRNKIIDKVCFDLLSKKVDKTEYGYFRAMTFLKDIDNYLGLGLGIDYLDMVYDKVSKENVSGDNKSTKVKNRKN